MFIFANDIKSFYCLFTLVSSFRLFLLSTPYSCISIFEMFAFIIKIHWSKNMVLSKFSTPRNSWFNIFLESQNPLKFVLVLWNVGLIRMRQRRNYPFGHVLKTEPNKWLKFHPPYSATEYNFNFISLQTFTINVKIDIY